MQLVSRPFRSLASQQYSLSPRVCSVASCVSALRSIICDFEFITALASLYLIFIALLILALFDARLSTSLLPLSLVSNWFSKRSLSVSLLRLKISPLCYFADLFSFDFELLLNSLECILSTIPSGMQPSLRNLSDPDRIGSVSRRTGPRRHSTPKVKAMFSTLNIGLAWRALQPSSTRGSLPRAR